MSTSEPLEKQAAFAESVIPLLACPCKTPLNREVCPEVAFK